MRLIKALIHCSDDDARRIAGVGISTPVPSSRNFHELVSSLIDKERDHFSDESIELPSEIKPLYGDKGSASFFIKYLMESRMYERNEALHLAHLYHLHYAVRGQFAYRIIFPVFMPFGLATWTGRAISANAKIRYKTLSHDPETAREQGLPCAALPIDETLFNYKELSQSRGRVLIGVEGPFDAMKLDFYGRDEGIRATCVFGTGNVSAEQVILFDTLSNRFEKKFLLFDKNAEIVSLSRQARLSYCGFKPIRLDEFTDANDPDNMSVKEIDAFFNRLLREAALS